MRSIETINNEMAAKIADIAHEEAKGNEANVVNLEIWRADKKNLEAELAGAEIHWENQAEVRKEIEQKAKSILDGINVSGMTMSQMCADDESYDILNAEVQNIFIAQEEAHAREVERIKSECQLLVKQAEESARAAKEETNQYQEQNMQLTLENKDIEQKRQAAADMIVELEATVQAKDELLKKYESGSIKVEQLTTAEQIAKQVAEKRARLIKVTNLRLADSSKINTREWLATDVLTGEEISINSAYKRAYLEVSVEEAEVIREEARRFQQEQADKAQREAEQQASIPDLAGNQVVAELEMPKAEVITQEDFRDGDNLAEGSGVVQSGESVADTGNGDVPEAQERRQDSVSKRLAVLEAEVNRLNKKVFPPLPEGFAYNAD